MSYARYFSAYRDESQVRRKRRRSEMLDPDAYDTSDDEEEDPRPPPPPQIQRKPGRPRVAFSSRSTEAEAILQGAQYIDANVVSIAGKVRRIASAVKGYKSAKAMAERVTFGYIPFVGTASGVVGALAGAYFSSD